MIRFDGQVALVTGAGRGLGRAYALLLAARGAKVMVHDAGVDRNGTGSDQNVAATVVEEIRKSGGEAEAAFDDLAVRGSAASVVDEAERRFRRLDVLIHSAGIAVHGTMSEMDDATFDRILAINGRAAIELLRAAFPVMARQRYGRIVLTVSGHGLYPGDEADLVAYGVSKAMQFGLMNSVAHEFDTAGIKVNAISPVAATRMLTTPVSAGSLRPEDVAAGVIYLASRDCPSTGLVLRAAAGKFSLGRYAVTAGVDLGAATSPEAVAAEWPAITAGPWAEPDR